MSERQSIRDVIRMAVIDAEAAGADNDSGIANYVYNALQAAGHLVANAPPPCPGEPTKADKEPT